MALAVGSLARVHGLGSRADVNGQQVLIESFIEPRLRWGVYCEALSERLALKASNLELIQAPLPAPTKVTLIIQSSLLPHASNAAVLQAMQSVGMCCNRDSAPETTAQLRSFPLSAEDLLVYSTVGSVEPPAVAMLRMVVTLLVAPSTSMARISVPGGPSESDTFYRNSIGLALIAIVEHTMKWPPACCIKPAVSSKHTRTQMNCNCDDGAAGADYRTTLVRWRDAFAYRFGVPLRGSGPLALWAKLQVRTLHSMPSEMLPDEPKIAAEEHSGDAGLHVEPGWLTGASASQVRNAATGAIISRDGDSIKLPGASAIDLLRVLPVADESGSTCACSLPSDAGHVGGDAAYTGASFDGLPAPLLEVARLFEKLRVKLCVSTGRLLLECADLVILKPEAADKTSDGLSSTDTDVTRLLKDGSLHARTHDSGSQSRSLRPSIALMLILCADDYCADVADCGTLHVATSRARHQIQPEAGTLVLMDCTSVERALFVRQQRAHTCIVCVLYEGAVQRMGYSGRVNLASLVLLERGADRCADKRCEESHEENSDKDGWTGNEARTIVSHGEEDHRARQHALQILGLVETHPARPQARTSTGACADTDRVDGSAYDHEATDGAVVRAAWRLLGLID